MRVASAFLILTLAAACGPAEEEDMTPAGPTLADFAGTWQSSAMLEGVEDAVPSTLAGSADGAWTMTLEGRDPIPATAMVHGDSLVMETEEYESVLRAGVMVSIRTAAVLQDGILVGNLVASYRTPDGVEQVPGTIRGSRQ